MRRCLLVLLMLTACPGAGGNGTHGLTTTSTPDTTGDQPTGSTSDACLGSGDCDSEGICVADYQALGTNPPTGMRGAAECVAMSECIAALDLDRWCFDHRGCCENLRCHPADGTCEPRGLGETTTGGDTDGSSDTGSSTTGSSTTGSSTDSSGTGSTG